MNDSSWALELADLAMAIDLASNLEPVLTQMCRVSYNNNNNNNNFEQKFFQAGL